MNQLLLIQNRRHEEILPVRLGGVREGRFTGKRRPGLIGAEDVRQLDRMRHRLDVFDVEFIQLIDVMQHLRKFVRQSADFNIVQLQAAETRDTTDDVGSEVFGHGCSYSVAMPGRQPNRYIARGTFASNSRLSGSKDV